VVAKLLAAARNVVRVTVENNLPPPLCPATGCTGFSLTADGALRQFPSTIKAKASSVKS
jgi:hypothetical protein